MTKVFERNKLNEVNMIFGVIKIEYAILYILIINCIGLGAMALDKYKSERAKWRIPEKTLFMITLLGGGIGTTLGMYLFRHKTKKLYFTIGFPTILISEIAIIIYLVIKYGDIIFK